VAHAMIAPPRSAIMIHEATTILGAFDRRVDATGAEFMVFSYRSAAEFLGERERSRRNPRRARNSRDSTMRLTQKS
jgi:hypothetical protein